MPTNRNPLAIHQAALQNDLHLATKHNKARLSVRWLCGILLVAGQLLQLSMPPRTMATAARDKGATNTAADDAQDARVSAMKSLQYLAGVMDQYHDRYIVYEDVSAAGNHFHAWSKIPDENTTVDTSGSWAVNPRSGATAIRCQFQRNGDNYGGFYFLNGTLQGQERKPQPNWGAVPNAGSNLTGATALTFWARGELGGETVEFFLGGVGRNPATGAPEQPFPDSTAVVKIAVTLTDQWRPYRLDLNGLNLSYVLGGFGWVASAANNPNGAVFYLDDIQYELNAARRDQRLNEPRLLRSFTTLPQQPNIQDSNRDDDLDFVLRNTAFVYDNALALLAFLADGSADSIRRAKLIGDAFVHATQHDRKLNDGSLRSAYAAGDIALPPGWTPNGRLETVPAPGFYDDAREEFFETDDARIVDTGNNAWAMVALLALHQHTGSPSYLEAARWVGNVIRSFRNDAGTFRGFKRGLEEVDDANPRRRDGASAEHNLDIYAAFVAMARLTGEMQWQADAAHARALVEAMWDEQIGCYWAGTENPERIYRGNCADPEPSQRRCVVPLDVQAWAVMALPDTRRLHPGVLNCAEHNHRTTHDGFSGFDFNNDKDGVWFEGTGQMAVAYALTGQTAAADSLRQELRRAQQTPPFGDGYGTPAACHDGLMTGFDPPPDPLTGENRIFHYYRRLHVGATAWNVFAQRAVNPYYLGGAGSPALTFRAVSRGALAQEYPYQYGFAKFFKNDELFYYKTGGGGGGRGFNVAAIDPCTDELSQPVRNFDTWGTAGSGTEMNALISFLNGLPNGTLVLIAVADDAGLTAYDSCTHLSYPWVEQGYQALEALGSGQIRNYCYRDSWTMVAVKGEGQARAEQLGRAIEVTAQTTLTSAVALAPTSQSYSAAGGASSVQVIGANGCNWTATSNAPWITINSAGNGTVNYSVAAHTAAAPRSGTITIAGQSFTVHQGVQFNDVPLNHLFYAEIGRLSARGVTLGCGGGNYCPDTSVTREQMAAFLSRALGVFDPPTPATQRFADVPPSNSFYDFIEEIAVRQITLGCGGGNYCPTAAVTREQMAAFIIRALHAPGYVPPLPTTQRFADVPPTNSFYAHIDELAARQITLGCGGGNYCPVAVVTRGQMAAFLVRAFNL